MKNQYDKLNNKFNSYNEKTSPQTVDNYIGTEND